MTITTSLSGNEIFCLALKGYRPGNIVIGNSVNALGLLGSLGSGARALVGGEITQVTSLIEEGRKNAYERMMNEARVHGASGVTGVCSNLIFHACNIEFLSIGSAIHAVDQHILFSTSADGQDLYAQLDAGYKPICFALGNVAYSMGLGRGLIGGLKTLRRGEIKEYSDIINHTRHLALQRIVAHAAEQKANAVLGIQTTILPFSGINEMLMIGTASYHPQLATTEIVSSDMTNIEMWNMASLGYAPMRLLLGTSVYSLGVIGNVASILKTFKRGEINELTSLIYAAREHALDIINKEAKSIGADDIVGVKTYVYQMGNGLIEFLAIGTAVKKMPVLKPESSQLPPQALVVDYDTFYNASNSSWSVRANTGSKPMNQSSLFGIIIFIIIIIGLILLKVFGT